MSNPYTLIRSIHEGVVQCDSWTVQINGVPVGRWCSGCFYPGPQCVVVTHKLMEFLLKFHQSANRRAEFQTFKKGDWRATEPADGPEGWIEANRKASQEPTLYRIQEKFQTA